MLKHVFASPHFDDAVGSCGGLVSRLVAQGQSVRIVTACGGLECKPLSMPAEAFHAAWGLQHAVESRRQEDASACAVLGCANSFLPFRDAIYRQDKDGNHLYTTFESLRASIADADRELATTIAFQLAASCCSDEDTIVYCPLAIGGHVDHVIMRDAGRTLATAGQCVVYYRDFHYDYAWNGSADCNGLERVDFILSDRELRTKIAAFSKYRSQISDLFGNDHAMDAYFSGIGKQESIFLVSSTSCSRGYVLLKALAES